MRLGAAAVLIVMGGCTFFAHRTPLPRGAEPVDITEVQNRLLSGNPTAKGFIARASTGREAVFATDGTASFLPAVGHDRIETNVSDSEDNSICLEAAGDWPGLCIELYETQNGQYYCDGRFGDGWVSRYFCALLPSS